MRGMEGYGEGGGQDDGEMGGGDGGEGEADMGGIGGEADLGNDGDVDQPVMAVESGVIGDEEMIQPEQVDDDWVDGPLDLFR